MPRTCRPISFGSPWATFLHLHPLWLGDVVVTASFLLVEGLLDASDESRRAGEPPENSLWGVAGGGPVGSPPAPRFTIEPTATHN